MKKKRKDKKRTNNDMSSGKDIVIRLKRYEERINIYLQNTAEENID